MKALTITTLTTAHDTHDALAHSEVPAHKRIHGGNA